MLNIRSLTCGYGEKVVLREINLDLLPGQILAVIQEIVLPMHQQEALADLEGVVIFQFGLFRNVPSSMEIWLLYPHMPQVPALLHTIN